MVTLVLSYEKHPHRHRHRVSRSRLLKSFSNCWGWRNVTVTACAFAAMLERMVSLAYGSCSMA